MQPRLITTKRPYGIFSFLADPSLPDSVQIMMYDSSAQMMIKHIPWRRIELSDYVIDVRNTKKEVTAVDFHGVLFETTILCQTYSREITYLCYKKLDRRRN
ncbi:MAG TPA: hypothetical protein VK158_04055 [Acidobacteriota bacterium]|nr:hypothetical protein [Acidobacteriota bacterium]